MVSYNEAVRRRFARPRHTGDLDGSFEQTLEAEVAEAGNGARIALAAGIRGGTIAAMTFRAWGCPHLIATLDRACEMLQGQPVSNLEKCDLSNITVELAVPTEKAGRVLLVEDALATLWAQYRNGAD